ncbi:MAG: hypothetical protein NWE89_16315 [Candidatus Bathyarchaeota archaeon]|nr:hypothetical protein [Candidatus Bathyarchaeota archaeon]
MSDNLITIARVKSPEPKTFKVLQEGRVPDRPEWMEGEPGYLEQVFKTCPKCGSMDVWRGLWAHFPAISYMLVRLEPPVKHSGRRRNCSCLKCGGFWNDIQAVPYVKQEESDMWWEGLV